MTDNPALWRAEIITDFRLRSEERCAAASPVPGFPQILESMLTVLEPSIGGVWVDLNGGLGSSLGADLGGTASWIERRFGQQVVLVDASVSNLHGARRLFAELPSTCSAPDALALRTHSVTVAIVDGVVSSSGMGDDDGPIRELMAEATRVLVDGGCLAVTDLWTRRGTTVEVGGLVVSSIEDFSDLAARNGFTVAHMAVADPAIGWWSSAATQVAEEIDRRHLSHHAYPTWRGDRDCLESALRNDEVFTAGLVLIRGEVEFDPASPGSSEVCTTSTPTLD